MHKNIFAKGLLLLMLLSASSSWAAEPSKASLADNTKVGIDFGFGLPWAWGAKKDSKDKDLREIEASPNISLGVMLGYSFLLSENIKIGPEIGCNYGFTRRIKTPPNLSNISLEEKYIQIPVAVKLYSFDEEDFYLAGGLTLGYEFDIAFSTQYKEYGKDVSDTAQPSGSLFLGGTMDFPKGFYLVAKFKLPLDMFKEDQTSSAKKLNAVRVLSTSLVGFDIGVDIMKWL